MHPRTLALLREIALFAEYILEYTDSLDFEGYMDHRLVRHGVERNFQTLGEAMSTLKRTDLETFSRLPNSDRIVGLRNRLSHGYLDAIDDEVIWQAASVSIPRLLIDVRTLLEDEAGREGR